MKKSEYPEAEEVGILDSTRRIRPTLGLCTMMLSVLLSLLAGELVVRLTMPQHLCGALRTQDHNGLFLHHANWSAQAQFRNRVVRYNFNELGLRSSGSQSTGARILCIGDSFTFGWLLKEDATFVSQLQKKADARFGKARVTFLNGGHSVWGTADYVRYIEEYGSKLDPDVIIVFLNVDDIGRSLKQTKYEFVEVDSLELRKVTRLEYRRVRKLKESLYKRIPAFNWVLENSHLVQSLKWLARRQRVVTPVVNDAAETASRLGHALFKRLRDWTESHSCELLVLTTGFHRSPWKPNLNEQEPTRLFMRASNAIFRELEINFFDSSELFHEEIRGEYETVTIPGDGHPNEYGASLIAELNWPYVYEFLLQVGIREPSTQRRATRR